MSYVIRRVYEVKPGAARKVATVVAKQAGLYEEAGQRHVVALRPALEPFCTLGGIATGSFYIE